MKEKSTRKTWPVKWAFNQRSSDPTAEAPIPRRHEVSMVSLVEQLCENVRQMAHITARIPHILERSLRAYARATGKTTSQTIRNALDGYLKNGVDGESFYDQAKRLGSIGCVRGLPRDLSTNPKHIEDFGK